jgi:uncharacterized protein
MELILIQAVTLKAKIFGLIGQKNISPTLFKTRFGIHTFFMKVPIDVIVLNKNYEVVKLKQNLEPWRLFFWNPAYNVMIELPEGFIEKEKIKRGDKIKVKKGD